MVNNKDKFIVNSETYSINARHSINFHLPHTNLDIHKKGVSSFGIKIFNSLSSEIKNFSSNPKKFKIALKNFLHTIVFNYYMNTIVVKKEKMQILNHPIYENSVSNFSQCLN